MAIETNKKFNSKSEIIEYLQSFSDERDSTGIKSRSSQEQRWPTTRLPRGKIYLDSGFKRDCSVDDYDEIWLIFVDSDEEKPNIKYTYKEPTNINISQRISHHVNNLNHNRRPQPDPAGLDIDLQGKKVIMIFYLLDDNNSFLKGWSFGVDRKVDAKQMWTCANLYRDSRAFVVGHKNDPTEPKEDFKYTLIVTKEDAGEFSYNFVDPRIKSRGG